MQLVVKTLLSRIKEHNPELNEAQLKTRQFGLEVILNELSKFLVYFVFFALLSLTGQYLLAMIVYCSIRVVSGGYHANSYWGCFAVSLIIFAASIFGGQYVELMWFGKLAFLLISMIITLVCAPVFHKNTPKKNLSKKEKFRMISILLVAFWSGISFVLPGTWSTTVVYVIFIEAVMQPVGKIFNPVLK